MKTTKAGIVALVCMALCSQAIASDADVCQKAIKASAWEIKACKFNDGVLSIAPKQTVGKTGDQVSKSDTLNFAYELTSLWDVFGLESVTEIRTASENESFCRSLTRQQYADGKADAKKLRQDVASGENSPMLGQHYAVNATIIFFWSKAKTIACPKI